MPDGFGLLIASHIFPLAGIAMQGGRGFMAVSRNFKRRKANKARHINRRGRFV